MLKLMGKVSNFSKKSESGDSIIAKIVLVLSSSRCLCNDLLT